MFFVKSGSCYSCFCLSREDSTNRSRIVFFVKKGRESMWEWMRECVWDCVCERVCVWLCVCEIGCVCVWEREKVNESACDIGNVFLSFYFGLWDVKVVFSTSLFSHTRGLDEEPTYYSMELYSVTKGSEQGSLHNQIDSAMELAQWRSVWWTSKFELQL